MKERNTQMKEGSKKVYDVNIKKEQGHMKKVEESTKKIQAESER